MYRLLEGAGVSGEEKGKERKVGEKEDGGPWGCPQDGGGEPSGKKGCSWVGSGKAELEGQAVGC